MFEDENNEILDDESNSKLFNEDIEINSDANENDEEQEPKKQVKPKRVLKNPRPKLNAELLRGPKGLGDIEKSFDTIKFKGKGYEEQDLKILLKTYEYWCHRLFPILPFKDCVDRIAKLGSKGAVQTYLKKVRSGLIDEVDTTAILSNEEDELEPSNDFASTQPLIAEAQIELTEEQIETIRRNQERAEAVRQQKLKKIQMKASVNLPERNVVDENDKNLEFQNDDRECINSEIQCNETIFNH